jgi:dipeptidyl aminopeptidase/acylaminoacyl peptidase
MGLSKQAEYGSWASPINAQAVAGAAVKLGDLKWDRANSHADLYWLEGRPAEAGRTAIVRLNSQGEPEDCLQAPWSARSSVHEYGGAAYTVHAGGIWFVNAKDQAIYHRSTEGEYTRLTEPGPSFADLQYDAARRCLYAVSETHDDGNEAHASIVHLDQTGEVTELATGRGFYASPRLSPDGRQLVWLCWDHPNMPWDGCELWAMDLHTQSEPYYLTGGEQESLFQPQFAPDGRLYIVSDRHDGWWNIHRVCDQGLQAITHEQAEFGLPQWVFGQSTYAFDAENQLYSLFTRDGLWQLARVGQNGDLAIYDLPFTHLDQLQCANGQLVFLGGSATQALTLCSLSLADQSLKTIRCASTLEWDDSWLSTPEALDYPTGDGELAHALFYPAVNPEYTGPENQRPPLLIKCHGGPTGATTTTLDPRIQFWTSRGFAVLDVNYRGSTGYGRAYRQKLYGNWGIADVQDCEYGARYLAERGLVDAGKVVITGSSAGGYTVLCVLCFSDIAAAGTSYYGIADLQRLLASTHKFESRYLGRLIGDDPALLRQRSPLYHAENVTCPVLFLQGLKDKVVPPDQATAMADVLRERGVPVAYVSFPKERHGFKAAENIVRALESELAFYARVLGFSPADSLPSLQIDNDP